MNILSICAAVIGFLVMTLAIVAACAYVFWVFVRMVEGVREEGRRAAHFTVGQVIYASARHLAAHPDAEKALQLVGISLMHRGDVEGERILRAFTNNDAAAVDPCPSPHHRCAPHGGTFTIPPAWHRNARGCGRRWLSGSDRALPLTRRMRRVR